MVQKQKQNKTKQFKEIVSSHEVNYDYPFVLTYI